MLQKSVRSCSTGILQQPQRIRRSLARARSPFRLIRDCSGQQRLAAAPRCQLRLNTAAATMSPSSLGPALPSRHNGKRRSRGRVSQETIHVWVRSVFDDQAGRRIVFSYPLVAHTDMPHKMKLGHSFMRWKRRFHEVITITEKAPTRTLS